MRIGIDASNLRVGGGITHLSELLRAGEPREHGIGQVVVWGGRDTLKHIPDRPWLKTFHEPLLDRPLAARLYWQRVKLPKLARQSCELLFVPGGSGGAFKPFVTMSQNMLPFQAEERRRYNSSWIGLRLRLLRLSQSKSFNEAEGLIYLTEYSRSVVTEQTNTSNVRSTTIPHGISRRFYLAPRAQRPIGDYSEREPFRLLYVSMVDMYKHQWHVAEAVSQLRRMGLPVVLDLVGAAYGPALRRLQEVTARLDPHGSFIRYRGPAPYSELHSFYHQADAFIFASSCECMPNIVLEAMAAGLPIACSGRGPMPELLGSAGVYFDPENPTEIVTALRSLIMSPETRGRCAAESYERARQYSWERCARETFSFLAEVAGSHS